jgi:predicted RNA-binding Zn-ribbon protein involved in translation (DUF1610 family)
MRRAICPHCGLVMEIRKRDHESRLVISETVSVVLTMNEVDTFTCPGCDEYLLPSIVEDKQEAISLALK